MLGERNERNLQSRRLGCRPLGGGNGDETQALAMTSSEGLDGIDRRRAGAQSDNHAILDQLHCGLRGRAFKGVPLGAGLGSRGAHDRAAAAKAFARMAAMAAA